MPIPVACSFAVGKLPGITTLAFVPMGQPKRKKARQSKRYEESMQSRKWTKVRNTKELYILEAVVCLYGMVVITITIMSAQD
jgi:hypothetical protein